MNILVVCHYGMFQKSNSSFVYNQARVYTELGHCVRVIVPIAIGKCDEDGRRGNAGMKVVEDGKMKIFYLRHLSLSVYGKKHLNTWCAMLALKMHCAKVLKGFQPDVIHAHTLGFDGEMGAWLKKRCSVPLVITTHGSDAADPLNRGETEWVKSACDAADAIVAVGAPLGERVRNTATSTPVHVIYNGFISWDPEKEIARDPYRIIQVGNLLPSKRVHVTIQAFAELRKLYPQMTLCIVGNGPERESLDQLCAELNVSDAVEFLGQRGNKEVAEELRKSTYFVMASKPEGFGIAYLEAMAAGCITIGTKGEGIDGVIRDGENGYLVDADDVTAIVEIVRNCFTKKEEVICVAEAGQETAHALTWEANAEKCVDLFRELV